MIAKPLVLNQRRCDIYFRATGRVDINANVVRAMGLENGDSINLTRIDNEVYLYISSKASNRANKNVRFKNAVHPSKVGSGHFRCQCKALTDCMNEIVGAKESWLFVGKTKDLSCYGICSIGIPIIYKNNQYNGE